MVQYPLKWGVGVKTQVLPFILDVDSALSCSDDWSDPATKKL